MVVTFLPSTLEIGVEHERTATPSTCTVQAPHSAMPQPYLVPVKPMVSRSTQSRGVSGDTSTSRGSRLRRKRVVAMRKFLRSGVVLDSSGRMEVSTGYSGVASARSSIGDWRYNAERCWFRARITMKWRSLEESALQTETRSLRAIYAECK